MEVDHGFFSWLRSAGLEPPRQDLSGLLARSPDPLRALENLKAVWQQVRDRASGSWARTRADRNLALLGGCLSEGSWIDSHDSPPILKLAARWLGPRYWWFSSLPEEPRLAVVSSRLPRSLDPQGPWLVGLRAAIEHIARQGASVLTAHGTAGHELIHRAALRRKLTAICIRCCDVRVRSLRAWAADWVRLLENRSSSSEVYVWALPPANVAETRGLVPERTLEGIPQRDRAAVALGDQVFVLRLRSKGNLHQLLLRRLEEAEAAVELVDLPGLQPDPLREDLLRRGARLRSPPDRPGPMPKQKTARDPTGCNDSAQTATERNPLSLRNRVSDQKRLAELPARPVPSLRQGGLGGVFFSRDGLPSWSAQSHWDFLTHCTRGCPGPWPDESPEQYLDSLLDGAPGADHSALAALVRILRQRRLHASKHAIRGGHRVVSFTAVRLLALAQLRVFRRHRGRWDFEPYRRPSPIPATPRQPACKAMADQRL